MASTYQLQNKLINTALFALGGIALVLVVALTYWLYPRSPTTTPSVADPVIQPSASSTSLIPSPSTTATVAAKPPVASKAAAKPVQQDSAFANSSASKIEIPAFSTPSDTHQQALTILKNLGDSFSQIPTLPSATPLSGPASSNGNTSVPSSLRRSPQQQLQQLQQQQQQLNAELKALQQRLHNQQQP